MIGNAPLLGEKMTEEDLAARVVEWLESQHWTVYQEVMAGLGVCDIVAVREPAVWCVECKTSLGLPVICQAHDWMRWANYSSVAVPTSKKPRHPFVSRLLEDCGIGCVEVGRSWLGQKEIRETVRPKFQRRVCSHLRSKLHPEQKTGEFAPAGTSKGGYFTPFAKTKRAVQNLVKKRGEMRLKTLVDELDHHYASDSSAKQSLAKLIECGVIEGVALERNGRRIVVKRKESRKD